MSVTSFMDDPSTQISVSLYCRPFGPKKRATIRSVDSSSNVQSRAFASFTLLSTNLNFPAKTIRSNAKTDCRSTTKRFAEI